MSKHVRKYYLFFSGDAARIIGVHVSTINRWLNSGKIIGYQAPNKHWLISLDEINRIRHEWYLLPELLEEDIDHYWKTGEVIIKHV